MKTLVPITLTDAMLVSSTLPEPATVGFPAYEPQDAEVWVSGGSYYAGEYRSRTTNVHKVYIALQTNTGRTALPETDTLYWAEVRPTNRWRMFSDIYGYSTMAESGSTTFNHVIKPGVFTCIGFAGIVATTIQVQIKATTGGSTVYNTTKTVTGLSQIYFDDCPTGYSAREVTITVSRTGAQPEVARCVMGVLVDIGGIEYGTEIGIIDYSRKETNEFGSTTFVRRRYAKKINTKVEVTTSNLKATFDLLSSLRSTPTFWLMSTVTGYELINYFGFYNEFTIDLSYPSVNYCTITIEEFL